jgi:glutamine synthetase
MEIEAAKELSNQAGLKARASKQALDLFSDLGIMNHIEVEARYEIELEEYTKKIQIEGRVLGDIATNHVIQQLYVIKTL